MISLTLDREEFAARRRKIQDDLVERLQGVIGATFGEGDIENLDRAIETIFIEIYTSETDQPMRRQPLNSVRTAVRKALSKANEDSSVHVTALMVGQAIINAATMAAADAEEEGLVLEWTTMHDNDVRPTHAEADGQRRPPGEKFDVGGHEMRYPGDPTAPVDLWINCRCVLQPSRGALSAATFPTDPISIVKYGSEATATTPAGDAITNDSTNVTYADSQQPQGAVMTVTETEKDVAEEVPEVPYEEAEAPIEDVTGVPWHGVLAPEGVFSGDKRKFAEGSLRHRDLPLPLTWQKLSADGHDQSVVVAMIERLEILDGLAQAEGHFLTAMPEADEVVGLIGEFGKFGVSVDADDSEMEFNEETEEAVWTDARICSASIVPIPAFAEAYVALGPNPVFAGGDEDDDVTGADVDPSMEETEVLDEAALAYIESFRDVPTDERKRRAEDGTAMPDGSYPIGNCDDLKNAIQAIGRASDPEATKRHIKKRKSALGCDEVELPDGWAAEAAAFSADDWNDIEKFISIAPGRTEDGPGWLTHPVDTDRLRDYWVRGPGAAKIGWGTPGDFNRCRVNVAEYVKPQHLNGYCANRHFDALGFWPGPNAHASETMELSLTDPAPALNVITAGGGFCAPSEWFKDPEFAGPTPLTVTDEGEVYGHIAQWGQCHIGLNGKCTTAPPSASDYDWFAMGEIETTDGPVRVGQLTVDLPHADAKAPARIAMAHYDDSRAVWADVAVGEDDYGIWFHGMVRPGTSDERLYAVKANGQVSGDWRWNEATQTQELVAALVVNVPGFPTPRPKVGLVAGAQTSLVAAGIVAKFAIDEPEEDNGVKTLAAAIADELEARERRTAQMAELRARYTAPGALPEQSETEEE
jgi:hypothetical protein